MIRLQHQFKGFIHLNFSLIEVVFYSVFAN